MLVKSDMDNKVSVIIPAYNVENYLEECVNSIIKQTYSNIQIIIIDDGSTDNTLKVCEKLQSKDRRIEFYHKENSGLGASRNVGLAKATGNYLMFVDSDDYLAPNMVKKLLSVSVKYNANIVMCNNYMFDQDHHISCYSNQDRINKFGKWSRSDFWNQLYSGNWGLCTVSWNKLYSAKLFKNIRFRENKLNEDDFITTELIQAVDYIYVIPDRLYFYRINRMDSIMANDKSNDPDYLDGVEAQMERFQNAKENNETILMKYCYRSIPRLMIKQYGCKYDKRFIYYKEMYRKIFNEMCDNKMLSLQLVSLFILFYYFTPLFHLAVMLKDK